MAGSSLVVASLIFAFIALQGCTGNPGAASLTPNSQTQALHTSDVGGGPVNTRGIDDFGGTGQPG